MQGDELAPGGKNILARRAWFDTPHRPGRDCELNPLKNLRKSARFDAFARERLSQHKRAGMLHCSILRFNRITAPYTFNILHLFG